MSPDANIEDGGSRRAIASPKPVGNDVSEAAVSAPPKPVGRANLIHQQILAGLLANKTTVRYEVRGKRTRNGWEETTIPVGVPTLAGHVSEHNVNVMAKRWAA